MKLSDITRNIRHYGNELPLLGLEDYRRTAVTIPLIKLDGEWHILFEKRAAHIAQGGEISFPGGMMEEADGGEGERTAVRETCEELGLEESEVEILGALGREPAMRGMLVDIYVAVIHKDNLQDIHFNEEVERLFSLPLQYFLDQDPAVYQVASHISHKITDKEGREEVLLPVEDLDLPPRYHKPWGHQRMDVYFYHTDEATIWGLTARILRYFIRSIQA